MSTSGISSYRGLFDLTGRTAIVTGGGGGIGGQIALGLAGFGAHVVLAGRRLEPLEEVRRMIERDGGRALPVQADVTSPTQVEGLVREALSISGRIDILVNSHGINIRKPLLEMTLEEWESVVDINLRGTVICCREVGKVMMRQNYGKIVNISSISGEYSNPRGYAAYSPSKAGVNGLTKALACEWARYNITVNAIAPTFILTPLTEKVLRGEFYREVVSRIPLGRPGRPSDIVGLAVLLSSSASDFITGQVIYIDGGVTAAAFGSWPFREEVPE